MKIKLLNKISPVGLAKLPAAYECGSDLEGADAIMVRSAAMHEMEFEPELDAIARCGAGVNNIPLDRCAEEGIVVFNTPGANANGVKELTICAMLLASRDILGGTAFAASLTEDVAKSVEKGKSAYGGTEIAGKTLGVIGLGAIGRLVANAAVSLGMNVIGCDPFLSPAAKAELNSAVTVAASFDEVYAAADFLTLHVPATPDTKGMICESSIAKMKKGVKILNLARADLVNNTDIKAALAEGAVSTYVTDFPTEETVRQPGIIAMPHLGASTEESEDNCAVMAAAQLTDYLENGNIKNSVNFPAASAPRLGGRVVVLGKASASLESAVKAAASDAVVSYFEKGKTAVALVDYKDAIPEGVPEALVSIEGVARVREV